MLWARVMSVVTLILPALPHWRQVRPEFARRRWAESECLPARGTHLLPRVPSAGVRGASTGLVQRGLPEEAAGCLTGQNHPEPGLWWDSTSALRQWSFFKRLGLDHRRHSHVCLIFLRCFVSLVFTLSLTSKPVMFWFLNSDDCLCISEWIQEKCWYLSTLLKTQWLSHKPIKLVVCISYDCKPLCMWLSLP